MHGGWSGWSSWSRCGNTCGGGTRERNRSCTNPPPYFGGKGCGPHHYESKECALNKCPGWLPSFCFLCLCFLPSICMSVCLSFFRCVCRSVSVCLLVLLGQLFALSILFIHLVVCQSDCLLLSPAVQLYCLFVCIGVEFC